MGGAEQGEGGAASQVIPGPTPRPSVEALADEQPAAQQVSSQTSLPDPQSSPESTPFAAFHAGMLDELSFLDDIDESHF